VGGVERKKKKKRKSDGVVRCNCKAGGTQPGMGEAIAKGVMGAHLPADAAKRKELPIITGFLDYFPNAIAEACRVSVEGNKQHFPPGTPLHFDPSVSSDDADALGRHIAQRGTRDADGQRHSAKALWRAAALLERELLAERQAAAVPALGATIGTLPEYQIAEPEPAERTKIPAGTKVRVLEIHPNDCNPGPVHRGDVVKLRLPFNPCQLKDDNTWPGASNGFGYLSYDNGTAIARVEASPAEAPKPQLAHGYTPRVGERVRVVARAFDDAPPYVGDEIVWPEVAEIGGERDFWLMTLPKPPEAVFEPRRLLRVEPLPLPSQEPLPYLPLPGERVRVVKRYSVRGAPHVGSVITWPANAVKTRRDWRDDGAGVWVTPDNGNACMHVEPLFHAGNVSVVS
jgi:hypothetical protein